MLALLFGGQSCKNDNKSVVESSKREILETEKAFNDLAQKEGIQAAFLHYGADSAVLMRNNQLIFGKEAIKSMFERGQGAAQKVSLTWEPDFVDVSVSGDLGYTYGEYIYSYIDKTGQQKSDTGIFHTVWKRQQNGKWRFVWD